MAELGHILSAWRENRQAGGVLCTVVHVQGSAYRRPGARMLLQTDGARIGTISGGCLEGDVAKKAAWWTSDGRPVLRVYDTMSDDDAVWEFGLGCNGIIDVLIERTDSSDVREMFEFLDSRQAARAECVVAAVVRSSRPGLAVGSRLLWDGDGPKGGTLLESPIETAVCARAGLCLAARKSCLLHLDGADVFVEWIGLPQSLVILGAGHDAQPLAVMAGTLGWDVTVLDGRAAYARPDRFPEAAVAVIPPDGDLSRVRMDSGTAVVMMTHNFPQDVRLLPQVLARRPAYLGLLGPLRRAEKLFAEAGAKIGDWDVFAPAGLDIGGDDPGAIALSILSEAQAALEKRSGGPLRWRRGPIHDPVDEAGLARLASPLESVAVTSCEVSAVARG